MNHLYTSDQFIESYKKRCRLFNGVAKRFNPDLELVDGLTEENIQVIGDLKLSLPEPERVFSQREYNVNELGIGA